MTTLHVLIASTRPGRVGLPVGQWVHDQAVKHGGFDDVRLVDLAEVDLPLLDEPNHPRLRQYTKAHTQAWSETVDAADAFVFVHPEYNHGYPAALKNALDYLHHEWAYKPVGLFGYGGVAAGTRAQQQLKQILPVLKLYPVTDVPVPFVAKFIDDEGAFVPNELVEGGTKAMLDELVKVAAALAPLRTAG